MINYKTLSEELGKMSYKCKDDDSLKQNLEVILSSIDWNGVLLSEFKKGFLEQSCETSWSAELDLLFSKTIYGIASFFRNSMPTFNGISIFDLIGKKITIKVSSREEPVTGELLHVRLDDNTMDYYITLSDRKPWRWVYSYSNVKIIDVIND